MLLPLLLAAGGWVGGKHEWSTGSAVARTLLIQIRRPGTGAGREVIKALLGSDL